MKQDIIKMSVKTLSRCLETKELSALEAADAYLEQIEKKEAEIGAFLTITKEAAWETAKQVDAKRMKNEPLPPLAGIPAGIKDNICTKGIPTTCASRMLEHFIPPYDAAVMEQMKASGVVMLGKLNMDEFAMGSTTEHSYFKETHNPRDLSRVPGGSSGGAAAAVAAYEAAFSLGSDTGGSIRQPAAFCGVVGMKPTYGTVSRYGLVAFASSLDQIGPLTRTVEDNALVLQAIISQDQRDTTSLVHPNPDFLAGLEKGVQGLRIALPKEYFAPGIAPEIRQAVKKAAASFEKMGAKVGEASLPTLEYALPAYYVISSAEASSNLSRFDGVRYGYRSENAPSLEELYKNTRSEGFGEEVKRRILLGTFVLSAGYYDAYYKKAQQVRSLVCRDFEQVFSQWDLILSPVAPTTAYRLGEKRENPLEMYQGDLCTVPVNIAGLPALSMPCGFDREGLPIGMQIIGKHFREDLIYQAAQAFEKEAAI